MDFDEFPSYQEVILGPWKLHPQKSPELVRSREVWRRGVEGIAAMQIRKDLDYTDKWFEVSRLSDSYLSYLESRAAHPLTDEEKLAEKRSKARRGVAGRKELEPFETKDTNEDHGDA